MRFSSIDVSQRSVGLSLFFNLPFVCDLLAVPLSQQKIKVVVSNIFYFHPYLGKIPILTNIFQRGWNHQLENHLSNNGTIYLDNIITVSFFEFLVNLPLFFMFFFHGTIDDLLPFVDTWIWVQANEKKSNLQFHLGERIQFDGLAWFF